MQPQLQTNNNRPSNANQPEPTLTPLQLEQVQVVVQELLNNCLWYRIMCTDCDHASEILGVEVNTIRDWIKNGKLAASKVGNSWMIRLCDIETMLHKNANIINMDARRNKRQILL